MDLNILFESSVFQPQEIPDLVDFESELWNNAWTVHEFLHYKRMNDSSGFLVLGAGLNQEKLKNFCSRNDMTYYGDAFKNFKGIWEAEIGKPFDEKVDLFTFFPAMIDHHINSGFDIVFMLPPSYLFTHYKSHIAAIEANHLLSTCFANEGYQNIVFVKGFFTKNDTASGGHGNLPIEQGTVSSRRVVDSHGRNVA